MIWPSPCRPRSQTVAVSLVPHWMKREALTSSSLIRGSSSSHRTSGSRLARSATSRTGAVNTTRARPPRWRLSVGCTSTAPACSQRVDHERDRAAVEERRDDRTRPGSSSSCPSTGRRACTPAGRPPLPAPVGPCESSPGRGVNPLDVREVREVRGEREPVVGTEPIMSAPVRPRSNARCGCRWGPVPRRAGLDAAGPERPRSAGSNVWRPMDTMYACSPSGTDSPPEPANVLPGSH